MRLHAIQWIRFGFAGDFEWQGGGSRWQVVDTTEVVWGLDIGARSNSASNALRPVK
jgi:hypothetical protein